MVEESNLLVFAKQQLKNFPLSTLVDLYKSLFQDEFGPGHLLENEEASFSYLEKELKNMRSYNRYEFENCGLGNNFCRVPLDLILDQKIDTKTYFSLFLEGSKSFKEPPLVKWQSKWQTINNTFKLIKDQIANFTADSDYILDSLSKGIYALSHSEQYRNEYEPHYRIFTLEKQKELYDLILFGDINT